ncbi:MAG: anti-sigma factor antagonist [Candidatus Omnitrophica bacterium]|nr:anti-sigma factor antagonist [Candidatus Omnitrophota bacterium]MDD5593068.1 anti-sigma factor antagonist [Candidatus Omnitrophota bacterium]
MEIQARQKGDIIILDLAGRIDADSANLVEVTGQCIRDGYGDILCNFEAVDFIDYMGISAIVIAYKEVINNNGRMKFVSIPAHLRSLFSIAGLDKVIDIYATEDMAVNSFKEDKIIEDIKKMQLRRRFKRLPIDIKIELKEKYDKSASCHKGDLLNLSAVGAYIYGCGQFKLGDEVILRLKLPPKLEEIELEAKVVWLSDKQIQLHSHPGMGVEFCNLSVPTQQKLIGFIERNLSLLSSDN